MCDLIPRVLKRVQVEQPDAVPAQKDLATRYWNDFIFLDLKQ